MFTLQDKNGGIVILFRFSGRGAEPLQILQKQRHLHSLEFLAKAQIFLRLFRLLPEGPDLQFQLRDLVPDTQKIFLRGSQPPLGLLLAVTVFGNARRFFKDFAAIRTFQGKNFINAALTDIGIALTAEAGIHEQLVDVAQADTLPVDVVFALAGAVIPAGDHQLVGVVAQLAVGIVEHQRRFRKAHGAALLGPAEDDVLHFLPAQRTGILLAHDPADGVGNI